MVSIETINNFNCLKLINKYYGIGYSDYLYLDKMNVLNTKNIHKITNHPVHFVDEEGKLSPSAFIPFCGFGGNMSIMGISIDQFAVPVCNSFKAKILNDQLCYEVDPNRFSNKVSVKDFNQGLEFYVDVNEDRQYPKKFQGSDFRIYLDTLGKLNKL